MESIIGKILCDRYRIIKELNLNSLQEVAQGSGVKVYLASDLLSDDKSECLVKRYQPQYDNEVLGSQSWQRVYQVFLTQSQILQNIGQHPQIPQLIDFFECDREFYLVQEQIIGKSLKQKLINSALNESEAIIWLQDVANILEFIHHSGVVHLNIQPSNLIEHQDGKKFLTNLALLENVILTNIQSLQAADNRYLFALQESSKIDIQKDIHALGQTIIDALIGNSEHSSKGESLYPRNSDILSKINISSKLTNILHKMIDYDSKQCYQNINQVLADLDFEHKVVTFPPPFFSTSKLTNTASTKELKSNLQPIREISFQFKQILNTVWLWTSVPFIIASIVVLIGINKNSRDKFASYTNNDYNFVIQYPQDWSKRQLDDPITGEIVVFASPLETNSDLFQEKFYIAVEDLPSESTSIDQYTQTVLERINQTNDNQIETDKEYRTTIDKSPARQVIYLRQEEELQLKQMETFTIKGDQVYIAIYIAERAKFSKFYDTVDQMINSWKIQ
ncbi:MAG: PsbP-related protein [Cyanobacteria bacterium P01_G01_bin.39]